MSEAEKLMLEELRKVTRLLTVIAEGNKKQKEKIQILSAAGFQPKEIAGLIGTTSNTVSVALANIRKSGSKKRINVEE